MQTHFAPVPALYLSEEEAFALLDMCLMSSAEFDAYKESAMEKLTGLVRSHFANVPETDESEEISDEDSLPMAKVIACIEAYKDAAIETAVEDSMREHSGRVCFRPTVPIR